MIRRLWTISLLCLLTGLTVARAQLDALDLPTALYVLTNSGQVQRIGTGTEGLATVTPEEEFVLDFAVAPDDQWLAYRTEAGLYLTRMFAEAAPELLDPAADIPPFRGRGDSLAWSPDGDAVLASTPTGGRLTLINSDTVTTFDLREGGLVQVSWSAGGSFLAGQIEIGGWWIYRREGGSMALHAAIPAASDVTWLDDTRLVFTPPEGGLIAMDLAAGNAQTVLLDAQWTYTLPALLPDGTLLAFGREQADTETPEGYLNLVALPPGADRSSLRGQTPIETAGLRWAPGGKLMLLFRGGVLALVLPETGNGLSLPISDVVTYSWGPPPLPRAAGVATGYNGYFLGEGEGGILQVWRLPADGSFALPLTAAEADVTAYAISRDERQAVYHSGGALYLLDLTQAEAEPVQWVEESGSVRGLVFSPDGRQIAYVVTSDSSGGVRVLLVEGDEPGGLILEDGQGDDASGPPFYRDPQFAPNLNALLVTISDSELTSFGIYDLSAQQLNPLGAFDAALWVPDGRILVYGTGIGLGEPPPITPIGLFDPSLTRVQPLANLPAPFQVIAARAASSGLARLVIGREGRGPSPVSVIDLNLNTGALGTPLPAGFLVGPVFSPDGSWLAGQTRPDGPISIRDLNSGAQVVINGPGRIEAFAWGGG
jgi:Tol biopolymer transport system component